MQESNSYIDHDVNRRLRGTCEISRADVGNQLARFNGRHQNLEQRIESVANAAEGRLGGNNHRNNNQERALE